MSWKRRNVLTAVAGFMFTFVAALPAGAVEVVIDDFIDGASTASPPSIVNSTAMSSMTATDSGLNGVIGGVRKLTVEAQSIVISPDDNVTAGVNIIDSFLDYSSTVGGDGKVELLYDRNGFGLSAVFSHAKGIRLNFFCADLSSVEDPMMNVVGYNVTVTLTDSALHTVSVMQTTTIVPDVTLDFFFSDFSGVDLGSIFSVKIAVDPQQAGDLRFGPIRTFGTPPTEVGFCTDGIDNNNAGRTDCADPTCANILPCHTPAPLLSPRMIVALVAALSVVGLIGLARTKWGK